MLRSVRDAADRDIGNGFALRKWCFDRATDRDAGRLLATRLASPPFIDGEGGLFASAEGTRVVEATLLVPLAHRWEQMNAARFVVKVAGYESLSADRVTPEALAHGVQQLFQRGRPATAVYRGCGHSHGAELIAGAVPRTGDVVAAAT